MRTRLLLSSLVILFCYSCNRPWEHEDSGDCQCNPSSELRYPQVRGALLASRFESFEEFREVVQIEYYNSDEMPDSNSHSVVRLKHCSCGREVVSVLESGISQKDLSRIPESDWCEKAGMTIQCPFAVANRMDLIRIYTLARWKPLRFGEGDIAFFDIAESSALKITGQHDFLTERDSSEKGFINSFNHITAQSIITTCFSEEIADFVADVHELDNMPELTTGLFTQEQLNNPDNNPVDNYVDMINNEWGQELGKQLRKKYRITRNTHWTPELLVSYLNDLQQYYMWAFQINMDPFREDEEVVIRFADKINAVMKEPGTIQ